MHLLRNLLTIGQVILFASLQAMATEEIDIRMVESLDPPVVVAMQAKTLQPKHKLEYLRSNALPGSDFAWSSFQFDSNSDLPGDVYGSVHVLWNRKSKQPIWALSWFSDFQPHSIALVDVDRDNDLDLVFFVGYEDVFETYIYLRTDNIAGFNVDAFKKVYANQNDYSVLLDFDGDGSPEILDSGHDGREHKENLCVCSGWHRPELPKDVSAELAFEYRRLSKAFDQYNFTYNMPDYYPELSMAILDPVRILRVEQEKVIDVTNHFQEHLRWRLVQLEKIRSSNDEKCRPVIDAAISNIKSKLVESL